MKIKRMALLMGAILIGFVLIMYSLSKHIAVPEPDMAAVNDVMESAKANWNGNMDVISSKATQYNLELVIVDTKGNVRITTGEGLSQSINEAAKHRDTILDIDINGEVVGKVIVYNDESKRLENIRRNFILVSILFLMLFFALAAGYTMYLNRRIIKPFNKLRSFAGSVAAGNLDMPLEMDRSNIFGAFTESFDLMREELYKAMENERKANESKKELVASLSHDIKTPLSSIKAVAELMEIKTTDEKQKNQLQTIEAKADQIELLINNLFNATLEELKELKVQSKEEESTILYDMIKNADYSNRITKAFIVPECLMLCDKLRLQQVLDNIISNSYKYADTELAVSAEIVDRFLNISIRDCGKGVSEKELPLTLQKFYRGENAEGKSGSGLGLYISKYFMEKMHGDLSVRNLPDGFQVSIKLRLP